MLRSIDRCMGCMEARLTQSPQIKSVAAARSTGLRLLHFSNPEGFRGYQP
jgi:hypothetical protein